MNKTGHLLITKNAIPKELERYSLWIKLGSILPDILVHTYLAGHTWKTTFHRTEKWMEGLQEWGSMDAVSCLCLGYMLHYMEDYFTNPHNDAFRGNMVQHILYEHKLTEYICQEKPESAKNTFSILNLRHLKSYLEQQHIFYCDELSNMESGMLESDNLEIDYMETDHMYITDISQKTLQYFADVFYKNKQFYDAARQKAFQISAENSFYFWGTEDHV